MKADKSAIVKLLKTARGQIDGLLKMVEEDRYCMEISNQLLSSAAILKKANREVIKAHISGCVTEAASSGDLTKIDELTDLLDKL
ncbi:MAG: metal-sensing transcriptional repressor [Clostridia bacterium]|nr:metal-sensing transcriptional repressor [Clostridia bacterium]